MSDPVTWTAESWCVRQRCVEHPRVVVMTQQDAPSAATVRTYHVDGLAQVYPTAEAAIEASEVNPA